MLARLFINLNIFNIPVFLSLFFSFSVQGEVNKTSDVDEGLGEVMLNVSSAAPEPASSTPESTGNTDSEFDCSSHYGRNTEYLSICNMYDNVKIKVIKRDSAWSDLQNGLDSCNDCLFVINGSSITIENNFLVANKQGILPLSGEGFLELVPSSSFEFSRPKNSLSLVEVDDYAQIGGLKINGQNFYRFLPKKDKGQLASVLFIRTTRHIYLTMLDLSGADYFDSVVVALTGGNDPSVMDLKHSFLQSSGSQNVIKIESLSADPGVFVSNVVIKLNTKELLEQNGIIFIGGNVRATSLTFISDGKTERSGTKRYFLTNGIYDPIEKIKSMKDGSFLRIHVDSSVFIVENKNHSSPTIIYRGNKDKDEISDRFYLEFVGNLYLGGEEGTPWLNNKGEIDFSGVWSENVMREWTGKNGGITADAFFKERKGYAGNVNVGTFEYAGPANYSSVANWFYMAMTSRKAWLPVDKNNNTIEFRCDQPNSLTECPSTEAYPSGTVAGLSLWGAVSTIGAAALGYITYQLTHGRSVGPFKPLQAVSTSPAD